MEITEKQPKHRRKLTHRLKPFGLLAGAVLIFLMGLNIGNGRLRISNSQLEPVADTAGLPADLDYDSVEQVYDKLKSTYDGQLDADKLLDGLKEGLVEAAGDQYTEYLDPKESEDFENDLSGSFTGIGAELGKENDLLVVVSPISGFPAEKAGLRPKDVISKIDGEASYDLSVSDAVSKIRGEKGTKVTLTIIRGGSEELTFEIIRDEITIPSVTTETLDGNIGYMKISRYGEDTTQLARAGAAAFAKAGVKGVILDVRGNPGGLLNSAVELASLWLSPGKTVLQEKRGGKVIQTFRSSGTAPLKGLPTVVLIDEGSASASEITAGALRDNNVAKLIGAKTFGKGSVQQLEELIGGGMLKVTIARWYTPGGKNIDKEGIEPDQAVERTVEDVTAGRDPQKDAALEFLRK